MLLFEERLEGPLVALVGGAQLVDVHFERAGRLDHITRASGCTFHDKIVVRKLSL